MKHPQWLTDLFMAIDNRDARAFQSFLTEDTVFRFGNAEAIHGRANAEAAVAGFFSSIAGLKHDVRGIWETGDAVISHGFVTYTRHDASTLTIPFANIFMMKDSLVSEYLIFADTSALYATA